MIRRPRRPPLFPATPFSGSARGRHMLRGGLVQQGGAGGDVPLEPPADFEADVDAPDEGRRRRDRTVADRKSTRLNSSHANISYAVFCLKTKLTYRATPVT